MVNRTIENKKLGVKATIKENLRQRDLEAFGESRAAETGVSASQSRGANVRAAINAAWFTELTPAMTAEQVGDQIPAVVRLLGDWIDKIYVELIEIPPE